jgi:hypothetical protein
MTPRNGIPGYVMGTATAGALKRDGQQIRLADVPFSRRLWARLFAARYDQQIERGAAVEAGTPLAAHYLRLASRREREDMATALTHLLRDSDLLPKEARTTRVPIRVEAVRQSADVVEDVLARLLGPLPVRTRGVARLRILLSDGRSPLYRTGGQGTFAAAMRGVLAAM